MDSSTNLTAIEAVHITWGPPSDPNGDIVSYTVKLQRTGRDQPADMKCVNETEFQKNGFGWKSGDLLPASTRSVSGPTHWPAGGTGQRSRSSSSPISVPCPGRRSSSSPSSSSCCSSCRRSSSRSTSSKRLVKTCPITWNTFP